MKSSTKQILLSLLSQEISVLHDTANVYKHSMRKSWEGAVPYTEFGEVYFNSFKNYRHQYKLVRTRIKKLAVASKELKMMSED